MNNDESSIKHTMYQLFTNYITYRVLPVESTL